MQAGADKMQDITPFADLLPMVELWNRLLEMENAKMKKLHLAA